MLHRNTYVRAPALCYLADWNLSNWAFLYLIFFLRYLDYLSQTLCQSALSRLETDFSAPGEDVQTFAIWEIDGGNQARHLTRLVPRYHKRVDKRTLSYLFSADQYVSKNDFSAATTYAG